MPNAKYKAVFVPLATQKVMSNIKVVIVGDEATGKSSMLMNYSSSCFSVEYAPTMFSYFVKLYNAGIMLRSNNEPMVLYVWDTSSQDKDPSMRILSYPRTDVFVVCFSCISPQSFNNISTKWIPEITNHCPNISLILCATKIDLRDNEEVLKELQGKSLSPITFNQGFEMAKSIGAASYVECTAKDSMIKHVFEEAVLVAAKNKGLKFSRNNKTVSETRCVLC